MTGGPGAGSQDRRIGSRYRYSPRSDCSYSSSSGSASASASASGSGSGSGSRSHYYSREPPAPKKRFILRLSLRGMDLELASCSGVFSKDRVDLGTLVLLESLSLPEKGDLLDIGCGYGVIGIVAAKARPGMRVTMAEVNPVAVRLVEENLERNCVTNAEVVRSDLYEGLKGRMFDIIVTNPPLAAGYKVVFPMIEGAREHLREGGYLQMVLRKGVNAIPRKMGEVFGNVELVSKGSGYKVFRSVRS